MDTVNLSSVLAGFSIVFNLLFFIFIIYYYGSKSKGESLVEFMILLLLLACFITSVSSYYINFYGKNEQDVTNDKIVVATTITTGILLIFSIVGQLLKSPTPQPVKK